MGEKDSKAIPPRKRKAEPDNTLPDPEARKRFERAVDIAIGTKPMHKASGPNRRPS